MKTLQDELMKKNLAKKKPNKRKRKKKNPEKLKRYEIEELMGVKRTTYTRVKGSIRNK